MLGKDEVKLDYISWEIAKDLNRWRNLPEIRDWCRQHSLIDDDSQRKWYEWQSSDPNTEMFVICVDKPDVEDEFDIVGVCGLTSIDWVHRRAEFSCYVFPNQQRKGYANSALHVLFDHAFDDLNLNLIWGETFAGNPALDFFIDVLGMKEEGIRRQFYYKKGKYIDAHMLSITREEWLSQR